MNVWYRAGQQLTMVLLGWETAFDKVKHTRLHQALERMGIPEKYRNLMNNFIKTIEEEGAKYGMKLNKPKCELLTNNPNARIVLPDNSPVKKHNSPNCTALTTSTSQHSFASMSALFPAAGLTKLIKLQQTKPQCKHRLQVYHQPRQITRNYDLDNFRTLFDILDP